MRSPKVGRNSNGLWCDHPSGGGLLPIPARGGSPGEHRRDAVDEPGENDKRSEFCYKISPESYSTLPCCAWGCSWAYERG